MSEIIGILNAEDSINAILTPEDGMIGTLGYCGEQGPKGDKGDPGEDGSIVSVSATGTATDTVQYITIDGVEKKLAGGSGQVEVFYAIIGVTTFAQVKQAYDAGKYIIAKYNGSNNFLYLSSASFTVSRPVFKFVHPDTENGNFMQISGWNLYQSGGWVQILVGMQKKLTAGVGISIDSNNVISNTNVDTTFRVIYGVTPFSDILAAWEANKIIIIQHDIGGSLGRVTGYASSHAWEGQTEKIRFRLNGFNNDTRISCDANNNWRDDDIV